MRAITAAVALASSVAWVGCHHTVDLGGKVQTGAVVPGGGCSQGSDCASGLCLGQACCSLSACGTDPTCQGTSCDATGACVYPSGSCTPSCVDSQLTPGTCALGACVAGAPSDCPGNLSCATPTSCRVSCGQASDCTSGFYCSSASCLPQVTAGTACTSNDDCASGTCGVNGSGHCCASSCSLSGPLGCGASDCDTAGACVYPPSTTPCGTPSCSGVTYATRTCDGAGACAVPTTVTCPNSLNCNAAGTACDQSCSSKFDCATGNYCASGSCLPQVMLGACTSNDACILGICGLYGMGSCCASTCNGGIGSCGPTGCDAATGACTYTAAGTACVAALPGGTCDGAGLCASGPVYHVDKLKGVDTATCGSAASPCLSMTRAMSLVAAAGISGATLEVFTSENPSLSCVTAVDLAATWPQANETWPIHLGMGVTVHLRGLFIDAPDSSDIFDVYAYDDHDTGSVTLKGYDDAAWVGAFSGVIGVNDNVPNQTALPLVLEGLGISGSSQALSVGPGAKVTLGPGSVSLGNGSAPGTTGVYCKGNASSPASITDDPSGNHVLWIADRTIAIDAEDYCTINLTQAPQLGGEEVRADQVVCQFDPLSTGILAVGNASVTFGSAAPLWPPAVSHIWCVASNAIDMETSNASGSPTVSVVNTVIQYSGCAGARVDVGTFTATNSSFIGNHFGIQQGGGSVDVSGGGLGPSTFECSDSNQLGSCNGDGIPAIDLLNTTAGTTLTADNARVDSVPDGGAPEMWTCSDTTYSSCTCSGAPDCPAAAQALPEGADFVSLSTNGSPFSVTNVAGNSSGCP
jgi:hypothetical protein